MELKEASVEERFTLILDKEESAKLSGYDLYRSKEMNGERPVIDGFYIQRGYLASMPEELELTVEASLGESRSHNTAIVFGRSQEGVPGAASKFRNAKDRC